MVQVLYSIYRCQHVVLQYLGHQLILATNPHSVFIPTSALYFQEVHVQLMINKNCFLMAGYIERYLALICSNLSVELHILSEN